MITSAPEILIRSGFELAPQSLTPSLRIEITRTRALRFWPVLLGSTGVIYDRDRESVVADEEAYAFVERHRDELALMPEELAPEAVRNARPVRLEGDVVFDFETANAEDSTQTRPLEDATALLEWHRTRMALAAK